MNSTKTSFTARLTLAAATLAMAASATVVGAPIASAKGLAEISTDCHAKGGSYSSAVRNQDVIQSCTTTDKDGNKTLCSWINGVPQGCIPVARTQPAERHPQINITPEQLGNLPDAE